jgi:hypothetical protein
VIICYYYFLIVNVLYILYYEVKNIVQFYNSQGVTTPEIKAEIQLVRRSTNVEDKRMRAQIILLSLQRKYKLCEGEDILQA